jgi:hypothetical protein
MFRGCSLAENKVSILTKPLCSMRREPGELLLGEALQSFYAAQGCNNICDGKRVDWAFDFEFNWAAIWTVIAEPSGGFLIEFGWRTGWKQFCTQRQFCARQP